MILSVSMRRYVLQILRHNLNLQFSALTFISFDCHSLLDLKLSDRPSRDFGTCFGLFDTRVLENMLYSLQSHICNTGEEAGRRINKITITSNLL